LSDPVDRHLDKAVACLDDLTVRELEATAEALESRRHPLHDFSGVFRGVADGREGGWNSNAHFHLRQCVTRADDDLLERLAGAQAPFWRHFRAAVLARQEERVA
jgi:hypothetical protein